METFGIYLLKSAVWLTGFTPCFFDSFAQRAVFPAEPDLPPFWYRCVDRFPFVYLALCSNYSFRTSRNHFDFGLIGTGYRHTSTGNTHLFLVLCSRDRVACFQADLANCKGYLEIAKSGI